MWRERKKEFVTNKYYVLHNYASMSTAGEATETALVKQSNSKWLEYDCCLTPTQQFSAISWREQVNFQWNDNEVRFALDQHA